MDANERQIFEQLRSLAELQARTLESFQTINQCQPNTVGESKPEEDYPSIDDPDVYWSSQRSPLHEGMSLVTILIKNLEPQRSLDELVNKSYLNKLEELGIRSSSFYNETQQVYTILLYQPWGTEFSYVNLIPPLNESFDSAELNAPQAVSPQLAAISRSGYCLDGYYYKVRGRKCVFGGRFDTGISGVSRSYCQAVADQDNRGRGRCSDYFFCTRC